MKNIITLLTLLLLAVNISYGQAVVTGKVTRTNNDSVSGARVYVRADSSGGSPVFQTVSDTSMNSGNFAITLPSGIPLGTVFYVSTLNCDSVSEVSNTHVYTGNNINSPLQICVVPPTNFSGYVYLGDASKRPKQQEAEVYLIAKCAGNVLSYIDAIETDTNGYYKVDTFPKLATGCEVIIRAKMKSTSAEYKDYLPAYHQSNSNYRLRWSGGRDVPYSVAKGGINIILPEAINPFGGPSAIAGYAVDNNANILPGKLMLLTDMADITVDYTYTDAQGYFSFTNLPFGGYKVFGDVWGKDNPDLVVKVDADHVNEYDIIFTENTIEYKGRIATTINNMQNIVGELELYPNPATSKAIIKGAEKISGSKQLIVRDIAGKIIKSEVYEDGLKVSLSLTDVQHGIYFVELITSDGNAVLKLIK